MEDDIGLGNQLNRTAQHTIFELLGQGELAQLAHSAFDWVASQIRDGDDEDLTLSYPVGYRPSHEPMLGSLTYKKEDLIQRYAFLTHTQMPANGLYQLAMLIEVMLVDILRRIIVKYPAKLGSKRQVPLKNILGATSLEEVQLAATDSFINELTYKSPAAFAQEIEQILSVNLLECPAYHQYIEMKATRDILIHNGGIANETYTNKSGTHARVQPGVVLPVDQIYFLQSYEACLQFAEWLEDQLHGNWHSSELEARRAAKAASAT